MPFPAERSVMARPLRMSFDGDVALSVRVTVALRSGLIARLTVPSFPTTTDAWSSLYSALMNSSSAKPVMSLPLKLTETLFGLYVRAMIYPPGALRQFQIQTATTPVTSTV